MESVWQAFVAKAVGELDRALDDAARRPGIDASGARAVRFGRAYLADPWDAIPDDLPGGLEDDLLVLALAARAAGAETSEEINQAAVEVGRHQPNLRSRAKAVLQAGAGPEETLDELRQAAIEIAGEVGWTARDVDGATVTPPAPHTEALTVALYGRTSSGKTTLIARLIREVAPGARPVSSCLRTSPGAHTTKAPLVIDVVPGPGPLRLSWGGPHGAGTRTALVSDPGTWIPEEAAWAHAVIPGATSQLRMLDLPGTHGYEAGAWSFAARHGLIAADAIVLPMDRRTFREEELENLRRALAVEPYRHVAQAVRREPSPGRAKALVDERILDHDFSTEERLRIKAMPVFEAARDEEQSPDEAGALVAWLRSLGRVRDKRTYETLRGLAALDDPERRPSVKARHARNLMATLGVMRALRAVMLDGGDHVET